MNSFPVPQGRTVSREYGIPDSKLKSGSMKDKLSGKTFSLVIICKDRTDT